MSWAVTFLEPARSSPARRGGQHPGSTQVQYRQLIPSARDLTESGREIRPPSSTRCCAASGHRRQRGGPGHHDRPAARPVAGRHIPGPRPVLASDLALARGPGAPEIEGDPCLAYL